MRFTFIAAKRAEHTVTILCRCLRVTRSGFYAWHGRAESTHARDDRRLKVLVQASFHESNQRYGSPRVHEDLIEQQERVSRKRVIRLMQEDGLKARARKRYKVTTMSDHDQPVAANLITTGAAIQRSGRSARRCTSGARAKRVWTPWKTAKDAVSHRAHTRRCSLRKKTKEDRRKQRS
jgi:transposase InsO family protein